MMNSAAPATGAIPPSANEGVLGTSALSAQHEQGSERIQRLREVIARGNYHVSAGDLADALLRAARQAN